MTLENREISPKVASMYRAVAELFMEGADLNNLTVSEIAMRAGIGKGTVYEYFSSKEELLSQALYFVMVEVTESLEKRLEREPCFYDKIEKIMLDMEEHMQETICAFKVLYIMLDHSAVGKKLRQLFAGKSNRERMLFDLIAKLVQDELGGQMQLSQEDSLYLVMNIVSHLMTYVLFLSGNKEYRLLENQVMRKRLCMDVCKEVQEYGSCQHDFDSLLAGIKQG